MAYANFGHVGFQYQTSSLERTLANCLGHKDLGPLPESRQFFELRKEGKDEGKGYKTLHELKPFISRVLFSGISDFTYERNITAETRDAAFPDKASRIRATDIYGYFDNEHFYYERVRLRTGLDPSGREEKHPQNPDGSNAFKMADVWRHKDITRIVTSNISTQDLALMVKEYYNLNTSFEKLHRYFPKQEMLTNVDIPIGKILEDHRKKLFADDAVNMFFDYFVKEAENQMLVEKSIKELAKFAPIKIGSDEAELATQEEMDAVDLSFLEGISPEEQEALHNLFKPKN